MWTSACSPAPELSWCAATTVARVRAGYASLVFHCRGPWGVGGRWSWGHMLEDTAAVVAGLREMEAAGEIGRAHV